ncbi:MAG: hypothetical protein ABL984_13705 [Pyrinomonadaceae bacterium]
MSRVLFRVPAFRPPCSAFARPSSSSFRADYKQIRKGDLIERRIVKVFQRIIEITFDDGRSLLEAGHLAAILNLCGVYLFATIELVEISKRFAIGEIFSDFAAKFCEHRLCSVMPESYAFF